MKKILVVYSEYTPTIDAIRNQFSNYEVDVANDISNLKFKDYDLVIGLGNQIFDYNENLDLLMCHKSLLPAFDEDDPVSEAIIYGAKVTGITIYWKNSKKIVAQYPIFIENDWHYEDLKLELQYLEQSLLPIVAQKVLDNEIFDLKHILNQSSTSSCSGGNCSSCSGCGNCHSCSNGGKT